MRILTFADLGAIVVTWPRCGLSLHILPGYPALWTAGGQRVAIFEPARC